MEYTEKEKKQIRKSRQAIVRDMRKLWKQYPYEVQIPVDLDLPLYGKNWYLKILNDRIILYSNSSEKYTNLERHKVHHLQDLVYTEGDYEAHFQFIKQYDKVRKELEEVLKKRDESQQNNLDALTSISEKHGRKAEKQAKKLASTVQIDFPKTQNVHEIEITEEVGKKVGTIDFGKQIIKIVTEGDIVLVNKTQEQPKSKKK